MLYEAEKKFGLLHWVGKTDCNEIKLLLSGEWQRLIFRKPWHPVRNLGKCVHPPSFRFFRRARRSLGRAGAGQVSDRPGLSYTVASWIGRVPWPLQRTPFSPDRGIFRPSSADVQSTKTSCWKSKSNAYSIWVGERLRCWMIHWNLWLGSCELL